MPNAEKRQIRGSYILSLVLSAVLVHESFGQQHLQRRVDSAYQLLLSGDNHGALSAAQQLLDIGVANCGNKGIPCLSYIQGVAFHALGQLDNAVAAFQQALRSRPKSSNTWRNLGDTLLHSFRIKDAIEAHLGPAAVGLPVDYVKVFQARSWIADWREYFEVEANIQYTISSEINAANCSVVGYTDFWNVPPSAVARMVSPLLSQRAVTVPARSVRAAYPRPIASSTSEQPRNVRIGFISSDFGIHPVVTLVRGLLVTLQGLKQPRSRHPAAQHSRVDVFCYALSDASSWWRTNIGQRVHAFRYAPAITQPHIQACLVPIPPLKYALSPQPLCAGTISPPGHRLLRTLF